MTFALHSFGQTARIEQDNAIVVQAKLWYFSNLANHEYSSSVDQYFDNMHSHIPNSSNFGKNVVGKLTGGAHQSLSGFTVSGIRAENIPSRLSDQNSLYNPNIHPQGSLNSSNISINYSEKQVYYGNWGELVLTLFQVAGVAGGN